VDGGGAIYAAFDGVPNAIAINGVAIDTKVNSPLPSLKERRARDVGRAWQTKANNPIILQVHATKCGGRSLNAQTSQNLNLKAI